MAGFGDQIRKFATITEERADAVVKEAIDVVGARLIVRSPVKTGRFRSNWRYAPGAPDITETEETNVHKVNGIEAIPDAATAFTHFITNSLPYATALERGSSKQAPSGVVGITALEWESIVGNAVKAKASP